MGVQGIINGSWRCIFKRVFNALSMDVGGYFQKGFQGIINECWGLPSNDSTGNSQMVVGVIMKLVWEGLSDSYGRVYQMVVGGVWNRCGRTRGVVIKCCRGWSLDVGQVCYQMF